MAGYLYRRAMIGGLLGGSRPWLVLWIVLAGRRLLRRFAGDQPELVFSEPLHAGQALLITHGDAGESRSV